MPCCACCVAWVARLPRKGPLRWLLPAPYLRESLVFLSVGTVVWWVWSSSRRAWLVVPPMHSLATLHSFPMRSEEPVRARSALLPLPPVAYRYRLDFLPVWWGGWWWATWGLDRRPPLAGQPGWRCYWCSLRPLTLGCYHFPVLPSVSSDPGQPGRWPRGLWVLLLAWQPLWPAIQSNFWLSVRVGMRSTCGWVGRDVHRGLIRRLHWWLRKPARWAGLILSRYGVGRGWLRGCLERLVYYDGQCWVRSVSPLHGQWVMQWQVWFATWNISLFVSIMKHSSSKHWVQPPARLLPPPHPLKLTHHWIPCDLSARGVQSWSRRRWSESIARQSRRSKLIWRLNDSGFAVQYCRNLISACCRPNPWSLIPTCSMRNRSEV